MKTLLRKLVPKVYIWPDGAKAGMLDVSRDAAAITVSKDIGAASGRWSLTLLARRGVISCASAPLLTDVERLLQPNSVVSLGVDRPGGLTFGLVDAVSVRDGREGRGSRVITLEGSDFGKILEREAIMHAILNVSDQGKFFAAIIEALGENNALIERLPGLWGPNSVSPYSYDESIPLSAFESMGQSLSAAWLGKRPIDVLKWALTLPSVKFPALACLGGSGRTSDLISIDDSVESSWFDGRLNSEWPNSYQGTVWNFMRQLLDEDVYELFTETLPIGMDTFARTGRLTYPEAPAVRLVLRPKPFDEPGLEFLPVKEQPGTDWQSLRTFVRQNENHQIEGHEVYSANLARTDADTFSFYKVLSDNSLFGSDAALQAGLSYPAADTARMQRYGLRGYDTQVKLVPYELNKAVQAGGIDSDALLDEVIEFRNRLLNWYRLNDSFLAGSIEVAGRDEFKVGDPVLLPWLEAPRTSAVSFLPAKGIRAYVVGVQQAWRPGSYRSSLRLIRGHNDAMVERAKEDIAGYGTPSAPDGLAATGLGTT